MSSRAALFAANAAATLLLAACVARPTTTSEGGGTAASPTTTATAGTIVIVHQEGGIAGLMIESTVDGAAHHYQTVTRHLCGAEGASCPPPIDSAAGTLSDSLAAAVAAAVDSASFFTLRPDYGTDPRLRDGFLYTVTVERGSQRAIVRGDESTRPPALAALTSTVARAIDRARGRR